MLVASTSVSGFNCTTLAANSSRTRHRGLARRLVAVRRCDRYLPARGSSLHQQADRVGQECGRICCRISSVRPVASKKGNHRSAHALCRRLLLGAISIRILLEKFHLCARPISVWMVANAISHQNDQRKF